MPALVCRKKRMCVSVSDCCSYGPCILTILCTVTLAITPLGRRGAEDGGLGPLRVSGGKVWCTALKPYGRVFVLTQRLLPV